MNTLELIQALKDATDMTNPQTESVANLFFNEITTELANGDRGEMRGFCSVFVKERVDW